MRLPQNPPSWQVLLKHPKLFSDLAASEEVRVIAEKANTEYTPWEEFHHKFSAPKGLKIEDIWRFLRFSRISSARIFPLVGPDGQAFNYGMPDRVLRDLQFIEHYAGAQLEVLEPSSPGRADRDRYLVNSLMQEAITSSQLEGAAITLEQGKAMLRAGRQPASESERMVLNNYRTVLRLKELGGRPLSVEMIHDLQRGITEGTLDKPDAAGRFRRPDEVVRVYDEADGTILHVPPPAEALPERIQRLCVFANDTSDRPFIHPIIRAILLHFWLAYEHPYCDGNGRTARALFYWFMLKSGYWLMEFVSVSNALLQAPAQYRNAFLYTETDEGDTTYFIVYHLKALRRALEDLKAYIERKQAESVEMVRLLRDRQDLNHRQHALLHHALRHKGAIYTFRSHATSHRVSLGTARTDLFVLVKGGFLEERRRGREYVFIPARDLPEKIRATIRGAD
ncbi:MAG: Fic family protein [Planctomycetota bacterium]|nr:Fic family protein [Planctomycetota bacterium]